MNSFISWSTLLEELELAKSLFEETWVTLGGLMKMEKNWETLFYINFAPGTYFVWLYKIVEAKTSLECLHILKFSVKCTRISKIFVLNDLIDSWWPTENGKKNEKANFWFSFQVKFWMALQVLWSKNKSWIHTYLKVLY